MVAQLAAVLAPVVLTVFIGLLWGKFKRDIQTDALNFAVINIGTPCLIIASLVGVDVDTKVLSQVAFAALVVALATGLLATVVCKLTGSPMRAYVPGVVFSNNANMGLPLCLYAFGEIGLSIGVAYYVTIATLHFTFGLMWFSGKLSFKPMLSNPIFWAAMLAISLKAAAVSLPLWLANWLQFVGNLANPLMLILLGISLARIQLTTLKRPLGFAMLRVFGGMTMAYGVCQLLGLEGVVAGVILIQASTASAVVNYLLAEQYQSEPKEMAAMVMLSTVVAFASMPFLIANLI